MVPVSLPRQRRKDERPGELLAAALAVFTERGYAATRMEDVAARAGVSKGTAYLYFESKEALFKAAIETAMLPAVEAAEALPMQAGLCAAEQLRCFVEGWWRMIGDTTAGGLPKLLVAEAGNFPELAAWFHDNIIRRAQAAVGRIIAGGIARGEFRQMDVNAATHVVFAPMFAYLLWRHAFGGCMQQLPTPDIYIDTLVTTLTEGMVARKGAQP